MTSLSATARRRRDPAIDWLRGVVMVIMVLDHARDFVCGMGEPTNLATTTPFLFATRWITHYCAPTFVFLAGTAAYLYAQKHTPKERTYFLLTRGAWLVLLELTVIHFGWIPDPSFRFNVLQVIWAIGWSMITLAVLAYLPKRALLVVSLAIVCLHNLLDGVHASDFGSWGWLWNIVHEQDGFNVGSRRVFVAYPLVPWIAVIALGYCFGELAAKSRDERDRIVRRLGIALTGLFVVLRLLNSYGDPEPWGEQRSAIFTVMSFVNTTKYPPSLTFLAMTLGPALIAFSFAPRSESALAKPFIVFGAVPLFFYVAHLYLLRYPIIAIAVVQHGEEATREHRGALGAPLGYAYLAWAIAVVVLYPACVWFRGVKQRSTNPIFSYL